MFRAIFLGDGRAFDRRHGPVGSIVAKLLRLAGATAAQGLALYDRGNSPQTQLVHTDMRSLALMIVACTGCASSPPARPSPMPPSATDIVARSHAIIEAFDRADMRAIESVLASNYTRMRWDHSVFDRSDELKALAERTSTDSGIDSRQWSHERTFVGANSATFIGEAREQNAGNKVHGGGFVIDGWYTLGWARDGSDWKLVYQAWQSAERESPSATWDHIYRDSVGFNHEPNRLLTTALVGVTPGAALDVATGQGRNALYLAAHGWTVTGIDISDEGLNQAHEAAQRAGLHAEMVHADVRTYDLGNDRWDLVTLIYAPAALKRLPEIRRAVRPGGLFVYEYFAPDGPKDHAPTARDLVKEFAGWEILRDEEVEDVPDWVMDRAKLVRFVARKK